MCFSRSVRKILQRNLPLFYTTPFFIFIIIICYYLTQFLIFYHLLILSPSLLLLLPLPFLFRFFFSSSASFLRHIIHLVFLSLHFLFLHFFRIFFTIFRLLFNILFSILPHFRYLLLITLFFIFSYSTCSFSFAWPVIMCYQDEKKISSNFIALMKSMFFPIRKRMESLRYFINKFYEKS